MAYLLKTNPSPKLVETPDNRFVVGGPNDNSVIPPNLRGGIIPGVDDVVDSAKDVINQYENDLEKGYDLGEYGASPATDSSSIPNPASTIDSLNQYLNDIGGQLSNWKDFYDLMNKIYGQTGEKDFVKGDAARLEITEKIADMVYNFTSTLYSNAFQSQMWYEQQEYNSPTQQLHRLADAGLLGMWQQINTGNASSAANSSPVSQVGESDAGAIQQQAKQAKMDRIMNGIGMSLELASLGVQGFQAATDAGVKSSQALLNTTQASNIAQMTPHEVRNAALQAYVQQGQLRLLESQKALNEANIPLVAAQEYSTYQHVNFAREQLDQAWQNMSNTLYMFDKGQSLQRDLGILQSNTSLATANIGAAASKYAADTSASASMYGSDQSLAASKFSNLSQFSMDIEEEGFQEIDASGSLTGNYHSGVDLGIKAGVDVGGTVSIGGKTYKKVKYTRSVPASEYVRQQSNWCKSVNENSFDFKDHAKHITDYMNFSKKFADRIGKVYQSDVRDSIKPSR